MSLLTIAQALSVKFGIPLPGSAASSADLNVQQIVGYINEAGQELAHRNEWQALTLEATFTTLAQESQGLITTICATQLDGFAYILNNTIWDRTTRRPLFGPRTPAEWQTLKAQFVSGPWYQYRIRGNAILINPVPPAGDACYFEWQSYNWATTADGLTGKTAMTLDTDISRLSERLITLDAIWRFKQAKGLEYQTDFDKAQDAIMDSMGRDGGAQILNTDGGQQDVYPGVIVPAGNWGTGH